MNVLKGNGRGFFEKFYGLLAWTLVQITGMNAHIIVNDGQSDQTTTLVTNFHL